jgi:hypothetical protein
MIEHGSPLVRETEYHGSIERSFAALTEKHAPWALEQVTELEWASSN